MGLFAALAVPLWLAAYMGDLALPSPLPASLWHGHEMLFGYTAAVLAGFLLTATPSWSRGPPVKGTGLAALALIWIAGRLASSMGEEVPALAAALDLAFLPALALAIAPALRRRPAASSCSCRSSACSWSPTWGFIWMPSACCRTSVR